MINTDILIFKFLSEEAFPALITVLLYVIGLSSLLLFRQTKIQRFKYLFLIHFSQFLFAVNLFFIFVMDLIPNGIRLVNYTGFIAMSHIIVLIVSFYAFLKLFKQEKWANILTLIFSTLFIAVFALVLLVFGFNSLEKWHWMIYVLGSLINLLSLPFLIYLKVSKYPSIALLIHNRWLAVSFFVFQAITVIAFLFQQEYVALYALVICSLSCIGIYKILLNEMHISYQDLIGEADREKKTFIRLSKAVGEKIFDTMTLEKAIEEICNAAASITNASAVAAWVFNEEDNKYVLANSLGDYPPLFECKPYILEEDERIVSKLKSDKFKLGETYAGMVAESKEPLIFNGLLVQPSKQVEQTTAGKMDIDSIITVPVLDEEKSIGVLSVVNHTSDLFNGNDLSMVKTLAEQMAFAIFHCKELQKKIKTNEGKRDLVIASEIQKGLLPDRFQTSDAIDFHAFSIITAGGGGDFFSYKKFSDTCYGVTMSDVAGNGISTALVMMLMRAVFFTIAEKGKKPGDILEKLNFSVTSESAQDKYATFFYFIYDAEKGSIQFSNAANQPGLLYRRKKGSFEELDAPGMPLGIIHEAKYETKSKKVDEGDVIVLYTDGVIEALSSDKFQFSLDRLKEEIQEHVEESAEAIAQALKKSIDEFTEGIVQSDDQSLFIAKIGEKKT